MRVTMGGKWRQMWRNGDDLVKWRQRAGEKEIKGSNKDGEQ